MNSSVESNETAPPAAVLFCLKVVWISLGSVGSVLNLLVITVLLSRKSLFGFIPRMLIINRSAGDLLCSLLAVALWSVGNDYTVPENDFGTFLCRIWKTGYVYWTSFQISACNLVLFTLERYLSVVWVVHHRQLTARFAATAIAISWLFALGIQFPALFEAQRTGDRCVQVRLGPTEFKTFGTTILFTFFVIPLVVMLFCYSRMIITLRRQRVSSASHSRDRITRQLAHTVTIVGAVYIICFAPNTFHFFLYTYNLASMTYDGWLSQFSVFLLAFYVALNPVVYSLKVAQFRHEVRSMCCCAVTEDKQKRETLRSLPSHSAMSREDVVPCDLEQLTMTSSSQDRRLI